MQSNGSSVLQRSSAVAFWKQLPLLTGREQVLTPPGCPLQKSRGLIGGLPLFEEEEFASLFLSIALGPERSSALCGCVSVLHPSPLIPAASRDPRSPPQALQLPPSSTPDEGGRGDGLKMTGSSITQLRPVTADGVILPDSETPASK